MRDFTNKDPKVKPEWISVMAKPSLGNVSRYIVPRFKYKDFVRVGRMNLDLRHRNCKNVVSDNIFFEKRVDTLNFIKFKTPPLHTLSVEEILLDSYLDEIDDRFFLLENVAALNNLDL